MLLGWFDVSGYKLVVFGINIGLDFSGFGILVDFFGCGF